MTIMLALFSYRFLNMKTSQVTSIHVYHTKENLKKGVCILLSGSVEQTSLF